MSRRKPMAALAAVTATLAVAAPAATASAKTTTPVAHNANLVGVGRLVPGSPPCQFLIGQIRFALAFGNTPLASFWSNVFVYSGCGGAAI